MKTITRFASLILGLHCVAAIAANIEVYVQVPGYSQWPLVINGANTGGRVVYSSAHRRYITDRVARGERLSVYFSLEPGEIGLRGAGYPSINEVSVSGLSGDLGALRRSLIPFPTEVFGNVPTSSSAGPVISVTTGRPSPTVRQVPLGSRSK